MNIGMLECQTEQQNFTEKIRMLDATMSCQTQERKHWNDRQNARKNIERYNETMTER